MKVENALQTRHLFPALMNHCDIQSRLIQFMGFMYENMFCILLSGLFHNLRLILYGHLLEFHINAVCLIHHFIFIRTPFIFLFTFVALKIYRLLPLLITMNYQRSEKKGFLKERLFKICLSGAPYLSIFNWYSLKIYTNQITSLKKFSRLIILSSMLKSLVKTNVYKEHYHKTISRQHQNLKCSKILSKFNSHKYHVHFALK